MDTSPEYIKQCEKAEEIQSNHIFQQDDHRAVFVPRPRLIKDGTAEISEGKWVVDKFPALIGIWLPRQDQLQEMIFGLPNTTDHKFWLISQLNNFFSYWDDNGIPSEFFTWEQLWLSFLMDKKYDKVWDGADWKREIRKC